MTETARMVRQCTDSIQFFLGLCKFTFILTDLTLLLSQSNDESVSLANDYKTVTSVVNSKAPFVPLTEYADLVQNSLIHTALIDFLVILLRRSCVP